MTEQQAPTLQILTALRQALINAEVPGAYQHAIVDEFRLLAKNIDTASPSPASLQEAAISPSGIKTPPDEQIVAAWNAWPKTAITSRRSAIEFVRAVLSQRSADSPLASPVEAQELEDDPEAEAAFHMGYGGEAQETAIPSLPNAWLGPEGQVMSDGVYAEWSVVEPERAKLYRRAAPSLPAVLTDATCRDALSRDAWEKLHAALDKIGIKQPTKGAFIREFAKDFDAIIDGALATSATPVLP